MSCISTISENEHAIQKNILAGSSKLINQLTILYENNKFIKRDIEFVPSVLKMIDEGIVNIIDHMICCINKRSIQQRDNPSISPRFVENINISFINGEFTLYNDGYGIPIVEKTLTLDEQSITAYIPELLFTQMRTGTNINKDPYSTTGGTNGCGACIITLRSQELSLNIFDEKFNYQQKITVENNKIICSEPKIVPNKSGIQFTEIRFSPNWNITGYKKLTNKYKLLIEKWLFKRVNIMSLYCGIIAKITKSPIPTINYQNDLSKNKITSIKQSFEIIRNNQELDYSFIIPITPISTYDLGYNHNNMCNLYMFIGINVNGNTKNSFNFSVINGVEVISNPFANYVIDKIFTKISSELKNKVAQKNIKTSIKNFFSYIMIGNMMDVEWNSQIKDAIVINSNLYKKYNIDLSCIDQIVDIIKECLLMKNIKRSTTTKSQDVKTMLNDPNTFSKAILLGKKSKEPLTLILAEGLSAKAQLDTGLEKCKGVLNKRNTSVFALRGMFVNSYDAIWVNNSDFKYIKDKKSKHNSTLIMTERMSNNLILRALMEIMNLKTNIKYENKKELNTLIYSRIIIATDQDLDGFSINGSLLLFFRLWPSFFKAGMIQRLNTPLIRISRDLNKCNNIVIINDNNLRQIEKNDVFEFLTNADYNEYNQKYQIPKSYKVKYYKGLGTIEKRFTKHIFDNIEDYLISFVLTTDCFDSIDVFYGNDADKRKSELSKPIITMDDTDKRNLNKKLISVYMFMYIYVKEYQLDNVSRKLPKLMDAQNNATGKLLATIKGLPDNKEYCVTTMGGMVKSTVQYHHGNASLEKTIINAAQVFPGKKLFPILFGPGEFGTEADGGSSAAAPRYLNVKRNNILMNYLYRKEDDILLDYVYEDNKQAEPRFYLPILPTIILENYSTTCHGWKINLWGRDPSSVAAELLKLINSENKENTYLKLSPFNNSSTIKYSKIQEYIVGELDESEDENENNEHNVETETIKKEYINCYSIANHYIKEDVIDSDKQIVDIIHIIELPITVWTNDYIKSINNKIQTNITFAKIVKYISKSSLDNCILDLVLHKNWKEYITKYNSKIFPSDYIIYLGLRKRLCDEINIINPIKHNSINNIINYESYYDVLYDWFCYRRDYYKQRINRRIAIIDLHLIYYKNMLDYTENFHNYELGIKSITKELFINKLETYKFIRFNTYLLNPKPLVPIELLKYLATDIKCPDNLIDKLEKSRIYLINMDAYEGTPSFQYLSKIPTSNLQTKYKDKLRNKINELESEKKTYETKDIWKTIWKNEIFELFEKMRPYVKNRWQE